MNRPTRARTVLQRIRFRATMMTLFLLYLAAAVPAWAGEPADLDGDGTVGFSDFLIMSRRFGTTDPLADIDGDGSVSFADFLILSSTYGSDAVLDGSLPTGDLRLIVNEDLTIALRNPSTSDVTLIGFSFVSPNGNLGTKSLPDPFAIQMVNSTALQDMGNLGTGLTIAAGEQRPLNVVLTASFNELPDDIQFKYGLIDSDDVYTVPLTLKRAGDVNLDGVVGFTDFIMLSRRFGQADPAGVADMDGDGNVAFADFLILSANYDSNGQEPNANLPRGSITLVMDENEGLSIRNDGRTAEKILGCSLSTSDRAFASESSEPFSITMLGSSQGHDVGNLANAFVLDAGASATLGASWTASFAQLPRDLTFRFGVAGSDQIQTGEIAVIRNVITTTSSWGEVKALYR